jgi:hypothetical protein
MGRHRGEVRNGLGMIPVRMVVVGSLLQLKLKQRSAGMHSTGEKRRIDGICTGRLHRGMMSLDRRMMGCCYYCYWDYLLLEASGWLTVRCLVAGAYGCRLHRSHADAP